MDQTNRKIQLGDKSIYVEEGNVIVANEHRIPHVLNLPPFIPTIFLGREKDLEHIHDRLFAPGAGLLLLVNGEGGIGKTTLAAKYFHQYQYKYAHVAWILSEKNIAHALLLLAVPLNLSFDERMNTEERIDFLLMALANLKKHCLLVIDNVNELDDLDANYQRLRRCSNFHLLLTTRITHFERAETYAVNQLREDKSLELFKCYYRRFDDQDKSLFFQIREAVGGNTLVLELLAKSLAGQNRLRQHYRLANLLTDLQSRGLLQLSHSQVVSTDYQSQGAMRHEKPEAIISAMYDLSGLSSDEIALLSVFAVLPAENIAFSVLETLLPETPELDDRLFSLSQKGWIEFNDTNKTFRCSPVIQEIVQQKNPNLKRDCVVLVKILSEKLDYEGDHHVGASYVDGLIFASCAKKLLSLFPNENGINVDLTILNDRTAHFYFNIGNLEQSLRMFEQGNLNAANLLEKESTNIQIKDIKATTHQMIGEIYKKQDKFDLALSHFQSFNDLANQLYNDIPQNPRFIKILALSHQKLGDIYRLQGSRDKHNYKKALNHYKKCTELFDNLCKSKSIFPHNDSYKIDLAISYNKLGEAYLSLNFLEKALTEFKKNNYLLKEQYQKSPEDPFIKSHLAKSCLSLSEIYEVIPVLNKVLPYLEKYNQLSKAIYLEYPQNPTNKHGLADSYLKLGYFYESKLQNKSAAKLSYCHAKTLFEQLISSCPIYENQKDILKWLIERLSND